MTATRTNGTAKMPAQPEQQPLRILGLRAENVKRLSVVDIDLAAGVTIIGGRNGQGKSSTIDAIAYAVGGEKLICERPIRDGQDSAYVTLDLGAYVITRKWWRVADTGEVRTNLTVATPDGAKYTSQQALLNSLYSSFTFDPLEFSRQKPAEQLATLKALVGLDFSDLDRQRARLYEERTLTGRDVKMLAGQLSALPEYLDAPEEEVDTADILRQMEEANVHNTEIAIYGQKVEAMRTETERRAAEAQRARDHVKQVEEQLQIARERVKQFDAEYEDAAKKTNTAIGKLGEMERIDTSAMAAQVEIAREVNQQVRANRQLAQVQESLKAVEQKVVDLSSQIVQIDTRKQAELSGATFPVPGLSFNEEGVLFNGIPFSQASSAEQLRVSVAMGFSMNPRLKTLLIRDGSLLDDDSLRLVAEIAAEQGGQIVMERVGNGDEVSIVIEDGKVADVREKALVAA